MKKLSEATWNSLRPVILYTALILLPCAIFAAFDYPIGNWIIDNKWASGVFIWVLFSLFSGWFEAYYYNAKVWSNIDLKIDEHIIWNGIRFFVWISLPVDWQTRLAIVGLFPFIHDGKYYAMRKKLYAGVYEKGFWSNPGKNSTAIVDLPLWARIFVFVIAVVWLLRINTTLI